MNRTYADFTSLRGFLNRTVAPVLWRPWYDRIAGPAIVKLYFPLSRAWAFADLDQGFAAFEETFGRRRSVRAVQVDAVASAGRAYRATHSEWEERFFGEESVSPSRLSALENRRQRQARKFMALRAGFLPGHIERAFPATDFEIETEAEVHRRHGNRIEASDGGFTPDLQAPVEESHAAVMDGSHVQWLRFAPTANGETAPAFARVREPSGIPAKASFIFAHGIAMETEMWGDRGTMADWFLDQGFRVIEPQGPWHAWRRPRGHYGGEPVFSRGVGGLLGYSRDHVRELGQLIAWTRARDERHGRSPAPVLLAGISLGALTAMQLLSWAAHWPGNARPDHALLVTPAASLVEVAYRGSLTMGLGVPDALADAGWTEEKVAHWAPLLDAGAAPCLDPSHITVVLGDEDEITPFVSGKELVRRWDIPSANVSIRRQGHISASLGLPAAPDPLHDTIRRMLAARAGA